MGFGSRPLNPRRYDWLTASCWKGFGSARCDTPSLKGPYTQIVYTLAPKYPDKEYINAKVYTIWGNGPLGLFLDNASSSRLLSRLLSGLVFGD